MLSDIQECRPLESPEIPPIITPQAVKQISNGEETCPPRCWVPRNLVPLSVVLHLCIKLILVVHLTCPGNIKSWP